MRKHLKTLSFALLIIVAVSTCFELGLWQWHRAQGMAKLQKPQVERSVVELTKAANAGSNLRSAAFNRLVTFEAKFEKNYVAPNQLVTFVGGKQAREDVLVSLARLSDNRAVLVVRGLAARTYPASNNPVRINGRLYPRQNVDQAEGGVGKLSRLDPALVAGDAGFNLFDGYVIETYEGVRSATLRIAGRDLEAPQLLSTGGVFYWQHIAYVITWWFMGLLILSFPFYNRIRTSKV